MARAKPKRHPIRYVRIPARVARRDLPHRGRPIHRARGDFDPVLDWIQRNRQAIPLGRPLLFDDNGRTIKLADVRCGRTYYAAYREALPVRSCPSLLVLLPMINRTRARALSAAEDIASACQQRGCDPLITFQCSAWGCKCFANPFLRFGCEVYSGYCFRVDCIEH